MAETTRLGKRIRSLRRHEGLTQAAMAERLAISASYLNLIEHGRRPLSANVLLRLAQQFDIDLRQFASDDTGTLTGDLAEVFGDPIFENQQLTEGDITELVSTSPDVGRAVLHLYHAFTTARGSAETLAERVLDTQDLADLDRSRLSSEQVSDFIGRHKNHFPELEAGAERVSKDARLEDADLFTGLSSHLSTRHRVNVRVLKVSEMGGALRRFDADRRELALSEVLRRGTRNFQLAHQIGLLECSDVLDQLSGDPQLTSEESRSLCRVALANYFAGATLMPYESFLRTAQEERYDIDLLGHRFRASFEQVCHRLTSLNRRGASGVPFHMVRVDIAGNISKKFSASGIRFPRFSGLCPLWNVHAAFLQPGRIRVQMARLPDGTAFFSAARTVRKHRGGHHAPNVLYAISLGCDLESARKLVYADGIDLSHTETAVPVGGTCRLCERMDCAARAFPSLQRPLRVDENLRGMSFFTPVGGDDT